MKYLLVVGGVLLLQVAVSYATILAGTGNGSFVGLGAMLLGLLGIPATAIVNILLLRMQRTDPRRSNAGLIIGVSSLLPILQIALLVAQQVFDL